MQKIVNGIAIASGVISLTVVGTIGYVFIRKDAIIENVKSKVMESVMGSVGVDGDGVDGDGKDNPPPAMPSSAPTPTEGKTDSIILPLTFSIIASLRMNT